MTSHSIPHSAGFIYDLGIIAIGRQSGGLINGEQDKRVLSMKWSPYIIINARIDTSNSEQLGADDIKDSLVAGWLEEKLKNLQRELSEAYPVMDLQFDMGMVKYGAKP